MNFDINFQEILKFILDQILKYSIPLILSGITVFIIRKIRNSKSDPNKARLNKYQIENFKLIFTNHELGILLYSMSTLDSKVDVVLKEELELDTHPLKRLMMHKFIKIYGTELVSRIDELMKDNMIYNGKYIVNVNTFRSFFNDAILSITDKAIGNGIPKMFIIRFFSKYYNRKLQQFIDAGQDILINTRDFRMDEYEEKLNAILTLLELHIKGDLIQYLKITIDEQNGELLKELQNGI